MHRAACGRASALRGGAEVLGEGVSLCGDGLCGRRGMGRAACGRASRSRRACIGAAWGGGSALGGRVAVRGRAKIFGGEWVVRWAGNASRSLRVCIGAAWGSGSAQGGCVAVWGRAKAFGEERDVRAAGLTHIRRSGSRARVYYNIHPPCPRREIAVPGSKGGARVHTSPASPSAAPAEQSVSRSNSYPQWVIHGKVIHIVARHPVQNVLALAPAHAYI